MPSQLHETLLLLFRNRPTLAPELVREALHAELPKFARWARRPIDLGGRNRWKPWVMAPSAVPEVRDEAWARKDPELALLSAMAHGEDPNPSKAAQIAHSAHVATRGLDADREWLYFELLRNSLSEAARRALKAMDPAKYEKPIAFVRRSIAKAKAKAEGMAEGKAEGKAEGRVEIVMKQLALRFGPLPAKVQARIRSAGIDELDDIAARVLTTASLAQALAGK